MSRFEEPEIIEDENDDQVFREPFRIPLLFPLSIQPQYYYLNNQANQLLNHYVKSKIFSSWKKEYVKIADFKERKAFNDVSNMFNEWKRWSDRKMIVRFILGKHLKGIHSELIKTAFSGWSYRTFHKRNLRLKFAEEKARRNKLQLSGSFNHWISLTSDMLSDFNNERKAEAFHRKLLKKHGFYGWFQESATKMKNRILGETLRNTLKYNHATRFFEGLNRLFYGNRFAVEDSLKSEIFYRMKVQGKIFNLWQYVFLSKKEREQ
jgi:hypothetical protein